MPKFYISTLVCAILLSSRLCTAQAVPIAGWKSYLPYNGPIAVADAGDRVYAASGSGVYYLTKEDNAIVRLSKSSGLSDVTVRNIYYGDIEKTLVIDYFDGNLDFIINGTIFNFPFIKTSAVSGDKNIYHASFKGDTIILSCGFGIVLFDVTKKESPATYFFTGVGGSYIQVNATAVYDNMIYAASEGGLYKGNLNEPLLEDFGNWQLESGTDGLPNGAASQITATSNGLYLLAGDTIYKNDGTGWNMFMYEEGWHTMHLFTDEDKAVITQVQGDEDPPIAARILVVNTDGTISTINSEANFTFPFQTNIDGDDVWIADGYRGLIELSGGVYKYFNPNGPGSYKVFDMDILNQKMYVAPGEIDASWVPKQNKDGFFAFSYDYWNNYNSYGFGLFDSVYDIYTVAINPLNENVYFGSMGKGLLEFDPIANTIHLYQDEGTSLQRIIDGSIRISGLAFDVSGNLWISNYGASQPLSVKKIDGTWQSFPCGLNPVNGFQVGQIVIDDFGQKWVQLPRGGGILVYNDGGTLENTADDLKTIFAEGVGNGNLPSPYVYCLAKDKSDEIWVGTDKGVAIFYNPGEAFSGTSSGDASQPLVNLGGYNEYLLSGEQVNTIAVDGANRKWVGTNSGAFLISADGTEQLLYFNQDNSPLLSNTIITIAIDGQNGTVYFGTDKGICSYRYTATQGLEEHTNVTVFPNPVRESYVGLIAISGLVDEAQVKITDISGRLIYETTALGGQAVWDGNGYDGRRASTGVYLVYSMNDDGSQTYVTKFLLVN